MLGDVHHGDRRGEHGGAGGAVVADARGDDVDALADPQRGRGARLDRDRHGPGAVRQQGGDAERVGARQPSPGEDLALEHEGPDDAARRHAPEGAGWGGGRRQLDDADVARLHDVAGSEVPRGDGDRGPRTPAGPHRVGGGHRAVHEQPDDERERDRQAAPEAGPAAQGQREAAPGQSGRRGAKGIGAHGAPPGSTRRVRPPGAARG